MPDTPDLAALKDDLQRLRRGPALATPQRTLRELSAATRHTLAPGAPEDITAVLGGIRRALRDVAPAQRAQLLAELNVAPEHQQATLTERQESFAVAQGRVLKTVRRHSDDALGALALAIQNHRPDRDQGRSPEPGEVRRFWGLSREHVDIVCSEIPPEERAPFADIDDRNYLRYAKFADLDSLIYLRTRFSQLSPGTSIRDFAPSEYFGESDSTLVVVGGPPWNSKYRQFMPHLPYFFEPHPLGNDDPLVVPMLRNRRYAPEWAPAGGLRRDVVVFTRLSPATGGTVFLLGGCLTLGVLGAAKLFLAEHAERNITYLYNLVGDADTVVISHARRVGDLTDIPDFSTTPPALVLADDGTGFRVALDSTPAAT